MAELGPPPTMDPQGPPVLEGDVGAEAEEKRGCARCCGTLREANMVLALLLILFCGGSAIVLFFLGYHWLKFLFFGARLRSPILLSLWLCIFGLGLLGSIFCVVATALGVADVWHLLPDRHFGWPELVGAAVGLVVCIVIFTIVATYYDHLVSPPPPAWLAHQHMLAAAASPYTVYPPYGYAQQPVYGQHPLYQQYYDYYGGAKSDAGQQHQHQHQHYQL